MEGGVMALGTENGNVAGNKLKSEKLQKGSIVGGASRKGLADISNLPHRNQDAKLQPISVNTKEYIDKLHQENMALVKLLADRNKIIELSAIELQKLRINYQKVQQQNLQLAQANSHMLAELNSGKDKLKALHHELGCKNALLKASKLESEKKANTIRCHIYGNEVEAIKCDKAGELSQAENGGNKPCNTKRKRQSKVQSLDTISIKPVQAEEKADKKRLSSRRQSARFKSEEQEPTEGVFGTSNALGPPMIKPVQNEEKADKKRLSLRRQSARFKFIEQEPTEGSFEIRNALSPTTVKPVQAEKKVDEERICSRRQSARLKPQVQEQEPSEDLSQMDDAKFPVSTLHDDLVHENCLPSSMSPVKNESEAANSAPRSETQELRRSFIRPMRRAVEKVQSYKEIPLNVKMRRTE